MTSPSAPAVAARPLAMWLRFIALAVVPAVVWSLARWDLLPHLKVCLFQIVTGRPCPGCGMTRSLFALARGDVVESLRMHPLGVALAGIALAAFAGTAVGLVRGDDPVARFVERHAMTLVVVLTTLFVVQWVVRGFVVPSWSPDPVAGG